MSERRKSSGDRKAEIVETTLRLLTVTPVEKLSTARIAGDVGITQAAIFRHFQTTDDLWAAVLEAVEDRAARAWSAAEEGHPAPLARLRAILRAQLALIAEVPAIPVLIFNQGRVSAEARMRPIHRRMMEGLRARMMAQLTAAAEAGEIAAPAAGDAVDLFLGLVQGTVLRWRLSDCAFDLVAEGMRLVDIQIALMRAPGPEV